MTTSVLDVAAYIIEKKGPISAMKLQKLVYYCQAWSLVWDDTQLFDEKIQAWANGPVVKELFEVHRGQFKVEAVPSSNSNKLTENQKDSINKVLEYYGDKSSQWLSDLTHMEDPWLNARNGIPDGQASENEISLESIAEYYSSLSSK